MNIHPSREVLARRAREYALYARFSLRNRFSRKRVTGTSSAVPVVSLTTYGARLATAHIAIESIAAGSVLPPSITLWLTREDAGRLTPPLRRLIRRGLSIGITDDFGPHKKYFPLVQQNPDLKRFVTADDDVSYPRNWLNTLVAAAEESPDSVVAFRAHQIKMVDAATIAPYREWEHRANRSASPLCFPTGVGGVMYPPSMVEHIRAAGIGVISSAPRADDVWLHHLAVHNRVPVRQAVQHRRDFTDVPNRSASSLLTENLHGGYNDVQVRQTYDSGCLQVLFSASVD